MHPHAKLGHVVTRQCTMGLHKIDMIFPKKTCNVQLFSYEKFNFSINDNFSNSKTDDSFFYLLAENKKVITYHQNQAKKHRVEYFLQNYAR